ncbi:putative small secreted protein [Anoxybacillus vitaminiphilus]|uniref:Putative small secreted protein n=1 Tax=Paranoxybacillus vitaminiphilus TaxID=581036 RepID=A0A327YLI4_9BACL|nr:PepSY domain-containing protein [Anoxybacillus vitaminiphilus]RAK21197.1 putative small secreted protein [Anoxybacillus vitaminiphilus]
MSWRKFFIGVGVGFAAAYILNASLDKKMISSEKALALAKNAFKQSGPIVGSWIQTNPEKYEKDHFVYDVYKGGISRETEQYEFIIDAYTGKILETRKL